MNDQIRSSAPSPKPVTVVGANGLFGDFAVVQKLGEGGMGAVYLAEDVKLKRKVAIKTMRPAVAARPDAVERFLREAQAAAAVESDYIVPVLHVGEGADGTPFIVMPFLKGESLDTRLKRELVSPLWLLLKVAREVAEGLAVAHAVGLIHRDIKPANIWLEGDPQATDPALQVKRCKILDFGLARSMSEDDVQLTKTGALLGTPTYMAPEQARGDKLDHRTDLYSLGATLYRMAAGEVPFTAPNTMALLYALANETPRPLRRLNPRVPRALATLVKELMSRNSTNRPDSAEVVRRVNQNPIPPVARPVPAALVEQTDVTGVGRADQAERAPDAPETVAGLVTAATEPRPVPGDQADRRAEPRPPDSEERVGRRRLLRWAAFAGAGGAGYGVYRLLQYDGWVPDHAAERRAAEYVISIGGTVRVDRDSRQIAAAYSLPHGRFRLTEVDLEANQEVRDADLVVFSNCRELSVLNLNRTSIGDAGLNHLKSCTKMKEIRLAGTRVTDQSVKWVCECAQLREADLSGTKVTNECLVHFKHFEIRTLDLGASLTLNLSRTYVSDQGLKHLMNIKFLFIDVRSTGVTPQGIRAFAGASRYSGIECDEGIVVRDTHRFERGIVKIEKR